MKNSNDRSEELKRDIERYRRDLSDPYVQDKWVEQEAIDRAKRELENLRNTER